MWWRRCLCFSHLYIFLGILLVPIHATVYYMPQFTQLPPPIVYMNRDDSQQRLTCRTWPAIANTTVKMYYVTRADPTLGMYPVHQNWPIIQEEPGQITLLVTGNSLDDLHTKRLHCIAKTEFGGLLSRPFEVVEAFMAEFPALPEMNDHFIRREGANMVLGFLTGNLAVLDCPAPFSQPPALLTFSRNGEVIVEQKSKNRYRYVPWPEGNGVSFLIYNVQQDDSGMYQCEAFNPHTLKKIRSPWQYRLDVKSPNYRIAPQIRRQLYGSSLQKHWVPSPNSNIGNGAVSIQDHLIRLREGQNASLFCVMEASPVPSLDIYPQVKSNTGLRPYSNPRTKVTDKFGVYQINNVQPSDAGKYICTSSDHPVASSTAQVNVIRRLNIINSPMDIALTELGTTVRFSCLVEKSNSSVGNIVTPNHRVQWYRNGLLVTRYGTQEGYLSIEDVRREHLGIYQCVAISADEWISRYALLYLKDDKVLTKSLAEQERSPPEVKAIPSVKKEGEDERRNRLGRDGLSGENFIPMVSSNTQFKRSAEIQNEVKISKPKTITLFANLAVLLMWKLEPSGSDSKTDRTWSFRVQMQRALHHKFEGIQEIVTQWTEPIDILNKLQMDKVFITKDITAGHIYKFRVVRDGTDIDSRIESPWTNQISFTHVGITPPVITNHTFIQNKVNIQWLYLAQKEFPVSHFSILTRKGIREATSGKRGKADGYVNKTVAANLDSNDLQLAEIQLPKDEPCEIVILGQMWDPVRKLFRFTVMSQPINVTLGVPIRPTPPRSGMESHMYMIYIVTIAGAATTLIILILLVLCACHTCMEKKQARLRREDWLMNSSAVTNSGPGCSTMPPIYKDPAKLLHRENSLLLRYAATPPNGGDRVGDINSEQGNLNLQSAAAASLLNYSHEHNGTLGGGGINASSFMLASLTSQNQQQTNQSHYQAGSYGSNRFQSLQRGGSGGYQATPSMAMMKREPPSGGDSVNDNMDGYQPQQQQQQGGTLYHRGGPMSNSLAGSRLLLPHANSPPLTSTPMMAQAMSLQALHLASNQAQSTNHRDSMHLPSTNYMSSTTARGSTAPLSPLSPSAGNGAASLSPQQQQLLAWQQQQAMATAAMLNYTNQGGQTPNNGYNGTPVSPMDMYYAAAAAHALRMQHAAAMQQQQAATLRQHHQGDGNESVYSYFSQPTHQLHHTLDGNSPSTGNTTGFFPQHMTLGPNNVGLQQMAQNARPGSVQPPPTLQEQEEEQGVNGNILQSNGEMASNGTASISGRPPSSSGNHHHHHRRRRRKQPASGSTGQQSQTTQQLVQNQSHMTKHSASEENGELLDDELGGVGGAVDGEDGVTSPDPHLPGGNLPPPPSAATNVHHGLDNCTDGRPLAQVQPMAPSSNYHANHAKYVNHGSFPPPVAQYSVGGHHPNTSLYQSHYHHPHPLYQNSLNRRGTPTLLVEPPRMRDYSEYGIPPNQVASTSAAPSDVEDLGGTGTEMGIRMNNGNGRIIDEMGAGNRLSSTYLPPPPPRV